VNFDFSDDQRAIKRTAREFLASRFKFERIRELASGEPGYAEDDWRQIAELGWPGLLIPEQYGGLGLGAIELVVIEEELGYAMAPTPFFSTACATLLLLAAGTPQQREQWLPAIAAGQARGTVAVWDEQAGWSPDRSELEPGSGPGPHLTGTKIAVADAAGASFVIVSGANGDHHLVELDGLGVELTPTEPLDPTRRLSALTLRAAPAEHLRAGSGPEIAWAYATIVTALAAENVGVAQRAMEMSVEYAKDRRQFDRPIGSYQAVSHRCAQMLLEVEGARSLSYWAGWALDNEPQTGLRAASMAKAYAGDAGFRVTSSAIQVHGGIGFTWEHDLHFLFKRAVSNAHAFGDSRWHRDRVADLAGV
jgi:alkylation response protein AidB-like acyl-CoA dehydrogenase